MTTSLQVECKGYGAHKLWNGGNIFLARHYLINANRVPKNMDREGLQFMKTLTVANQESCESMEGLLRTHGEKFKLQHNETIFSQQDCKLIGHPDESTEMA